MPEKFPNKLNYGAFLSIVKTMSSFGKVETRENENRVSAFVHVFDGNMDMYSVSIFYRKWAVHNKRMPSIYVIISFVDGEVHDTKIEVGSYDQIREVKKQIKEFLSV